MFRTELSGDISAEIAQIEQYLEEIKESNKDINTQDLIYFIEQEIESIKVMQKISKSKYKKILSFKNILLQFGFCFDKNARVFASDANVSWLSKIERLIIDRKPKTKLELEGIYNEVIFKDAQWS